jgi:hypothetical protein
MRIQPVPRGIPPLELGEILFAVRGILFENSFRNKPPFPHSLFLFDDYSLVNKYRAAYGYSFYETYVTGQWEVLWPEHDCNYLLPARLGAQFPFWR